MGPCTGRWVGRQGVGTQSCRAGPGAQQAPLRLRTLSLLRAIRICSLTNRTVEEWTPRDTPALLRHASWPNSEFSWWSCSNWRQFAIYSRIPRHPSPSHALSHSPRRKVPLLLHPLPSPSMAPRVLFVVDMQRDFMPGGACELGSLAFLNLGVSGVTLTCWRGWAAFIRELGAEPSSLGASTSLGAVHCTACLCPCSARPGWRRAGAGY